MLSFFVCFLLTFRFGAVLQVLILHVGLCWYMYTVTMVQVTFAFFVICRIPDDLRTVLKPVSLILDKSNRITVLFPRMNIDVYDRLTKCPDVPIQMLDGLRVVQQMCDALENCWERGLYHVDLRITNVLVRDWFIS